MKRTLAERAGAAAFIGLVPLLIVLATLLGSTDSMPIAAWLINKFPLAEH